MGKCTDFPFFDPQLDETYVADFLRIVAPDRETFLALCARDIEQGYVAEVEEAARRMFPAPVRVHRKPGSGPVTVLGYVDGEAP